MGGCQPADASADNHAIEGLSGRLRAFELPVIKGIANAVAGGHYGMGVPVCPGIVPHAAVTVPVRLRQRRRCASRRVPDLRTSVQEICAGYLRVHSQRAIRL